MSDIKPEKLEQQIRIFLSLGGMFFFGPYVHFFLKKTTLEISQEDRVFIKGYAKLGYINIGLAIVIAMLGVYDVIYPTDMINVIYTVLVYVLVSILVIGSVLVFLKTPLLQKGFEGQDEDKDAEKFRFEKVSQGQSDILKSFVPCYNIYLRYKVHQFNHPFRWLKESLVWNAVFVLVVLLFHSSVISLMIILLFVARVVTLLSGIDMISATVKSNINSLFFVNVEEVWGDIKGLVYQSCKKLLDKAFKISLADTTKNFRQEYAALYTFTGNPFLVIEYLIGASVLGLYIYGVLFGNLFGLAFGLEILMLILVVYRYIVMIPYRQYPLIPIVHELVEVIKMLLKKIGLIK